MSTPLIKSESITSSPGLVERTEIAEAWVLVPGLLLIRSNRDNLPEPEFPKKLFYKNLQFYVKDVRKKLCGFMNA